MMGFQRELETYQRAHPELRAHAGKYVAIRGSEILGVWDSFEQARDAGKSAADGAPFLVRRIDTRPPRSAMPGGCLLSTGIVFVMAGTAVFQIGYEREIGFVVCMWVLPACLLIIGILLIRRAEDRIEKIEVGSKRERDEADAESQSEAKGFLETFDKVVAAIVPQVPLPLPKLTDPHVDGILERVRQFDLNRLNWGGWLLFTLTIIFLMIEVRVVGWIITELGVAGIGAISGLIASALLLAIGFFVGVRRLLMYFGVSLVRW
jgi:hypothetical protein